MSASPKYSDEDQELQRLFPLVKKWKSLYLFVLAELAGLIILFFTLSRFFS